MNLKKILIIAAHPDDDILGCGGTIAKLSGQGTVFKVVFIAEGTTCRFQSDKIGSPNALKEIEKRNSYAQKSLEVLGVERYRFYNLPCGRLDLEPLIDIGKIIEKETLAFRPDAIFTHNASDVHNDHVRVLQATLQATRPGALNLVKNVYSFEVLSSTEWRFLEPFKPNVFFRLEKRHVDLKIRAFSKYISEAKAFPFPRSAESIETLAKLRGMQIGCKYAEAFSVIREIL